jgi:5-(carboxyamino)imidazole ribonucleotide mutase/phosphoribosylaminoimidazole-succinocarboxamide synthase
MKGELSMDLLAVIVMGSPSDQPVGNELHSALDAFGIPTEIRIASAHKTPAYLLDMLKGYEDDPRAKVYITVAGRSNALSGMVDAAVSAPVIACPPYSSKFAGADIYSSLRTPSGVAPAVVLSPGNAALLAAKMLALAEPELRDAIAASQRANRERVTKADQSDV